MTAMNGAATGFLDRARIVAGPGFNRWLVPPCALAIHLCIGMAYGFSVFWLPLSKALGGGTQACPDMTLATALVTRTCDWRVSDLVWIYVLFFVLLGTSAALWGGWLEKAGPRKGGVAAAFYWCGGLLVSAVGIAQHQLWLMWLGAGVIGGIGLGIGYIAPVSTLIKWFPDRRGMATGMAIMGFGGGAMIGSPLSTLLIDRFATPSDPGLWQTFVTLAAVYLIFMLAGAFGFRVPPDDWAPAGWTAPVDARIATGFSVHFSDAPKTPQFWLLWLVLLLNVSASIGIISVASPMLQEIFAGRLIGVPGIGFPDLDASQLKAVAAVGAGFVGLVSLFNIGGRFFWASVSDRIGRRMTYALFFLLGTALYAISAPLSAAAGNVMLFVAAFCIIASMYGGGFATIPAYLADIFGSRYVGAIHGRLLTAWSVAGILGPLLVTNMRDARIAAGVPRESLYGPIFYILAGMLALGLIANRLVGPVAARWRGTVDGGSVAATPTLAGDHGIGRGGASPLVALAWLGVGLPLAWGMWMTISKAAILFAR